MRRAGWGIANATRSLISSIDLTSDRTFYMSFFAACDSANFAANVGLSNATNELMAGNSFVGGQQGLTAYYGTNGTAVSTNQNGTGITGWTVNTLNGFFVIEFVKSNSGTTNDVAVTIDFWKLGTITAPTNDISRAPDTFRTINLTGVSDVFDTLKFKVGGWPNIDEIRIGETWADVTGIPEPATIALLGLGGLCLRRRKA